MTIFETERLLVREWTESPADLERVFDIYSRWEVARWLGAEPRVLEAPSDAAEMVRRWHARYAPDAGRYGVWAIEVRGTGLVAGTVLLKALPGADNEPTSEIEVGWHLHPDSWGHGYATEAARGAVDRAFADGLAEIYAVVKPGNEASIAVTGRLGMTPLGRTNRWYGGVELESFVLPRP
ncbi:GNAT family N-acetyltransferase [Micromonospora sp. NPDC049679]|uniref:GNAT family N-acetyltransferase n=1 Tax=Micromonospora sp. NPDC049679 TaxID=3155920 RepID=UPI0033EB8768